MASIPLMMLLMKGNGSRAKNRARERSYLRVAVYFKAVLKTI